MESLPAQNGLGVRRAAPLSCTIRKQSMEHGSEFQSSLRDSEQRRQETARVGESVCPRSTQSWLWSLPHRKLVGQEGAVT